MPVLRSCLLLAASMVACHGQAVPEVSRAKDLYRLNRAEMLRPTPVKIRGTVTYNRGGEFNDFTMQDGTGGFIVDAPGPANAIMTGLVPGQEVEIEGVTMINPPPTPRVKVTRLTPGKQIGLPEPMPFTPEALLGGAGRLCYVEFSGVIREAHIDPNLMPSRLILTFGPPESRLAVWLARFNDATIAALKPDTRVRVHGVSMAWTSANLQPYSTFVVAHDPTQIDVLSPPQPTAALPITPIGQLLSTSPERFENRRQRIRGAVTLNWPGEAVVIQDETGGVRSSPAAGDIPALGDQVDGFGFSSPDQGRVILDEAVYQNAGPGDPARPETIDARNLLQEAPLTDRDALLIRTTGLLRGKAHRDNHAVLQMESQGVAFDVLLPPGAPVPSNILPGSELELTGVARFFFSGRSTWAGERALNRFEIHLPEMSGITVLSKPAWWTFQRLAFAAAIILLCLLLSLLWIVSLRHRVATRSALLVREIKARHDTRLLVDERSRLAADLHDTLSQTLSGAALQMEIADSLDDAAAQDHRSLARRLLDRSREDLRRAVWDLTPSALLTRDLEAAFETIATELAADSNCAIEVNCGHDLPKLPERTRSHLLRVGQEAIYNAIRHGKAAHIRLSLSRTQDRIELHVEDDGSGFDPAAAPGPSEGHLGLSSMRNRIQRLGGDFQLKTSPAGTTVTASVPIPTTSDEP